MPDTKRLTSKELAWELRRSPAYVCLMRRAGFPMPGGMATAAAALDWLTRTAFTCTLARRCPLRRSVNFVNSVNSPAFRGGGVSRIQAIPKGNKHP